MNRDYYERKEAELWVQSKLTGKTLAYREAFEMAKNSQFLAGAWYVDTVDPVTHPREEDKEQVVLILHSGPAGMHTINMTLYEMVDYDRFIAAIQRFLPKFDTLHNCAWQHWTGVREGAWIKLKNE
jgi:hypothetical protein